MVKTIYFDSKTPLRDCDFMAVYDIRHFKAVNPLGYPRPYIYKKNLVHPVNSEVERVAMNYDTGFLVDIDTNQIFQYELKDTASVFRDSLLARFYDRYRLHRWHLKKYLATLGKTRKKGSKRKTRQKRLF